MPLELPIAWTIVLNAAGLPLLHLGLAWAFTRMPAAWFQQPEPSPSSSSCRPGLIQRVCGVRRWKHLMPDGASWFRGGFAKASLLTNDRQHLLRFATETRRGEACHWTALALGTVFFLWNPLWADLVMASALALLNLPCIAIQRYNRARLLRILSRQRPGQSKAPARSARS